ncbi:ParB N-terminal domain-containing protein [Pyxidicoccus fallax]|uniref:ParB N-terminal domain-containing protein n=1 Tax=Pyxidicoccus fallax TaxID=394095 RepID=A0A848LRY9_9BACT|nr:ParB N-terminal domain-containing protein [Pyxidicoccus fallax]NMO20708.1 ParB N-terminal domain-containing protein [Pyxidicoccus fallax]NPC81591.1 ParB N-terminal domain-containing protein [Pyxidicoccus fallax]
MDAEHRVDGQEGMQGNAPEGGSPSSSEPTEGQPRSGEGGHGEGSPQEGAPGEHRAEGGQQGEHSNGGEHRAEGGHGQGGEHSNGGEHRPEGGEHPNGGEHRAEGGAGSPAGESGQGGGEAPREAASEGAQAGAEQGGGEAPREVASEGAQAGAEQGGSEEGAERDESEEAGDEEGELENLAAPEERLAGRVTLVLLPLEKLVDDTSFRLRPEGDVSGLATDIARLGQLFPVDVRPAGEDRYQLVCGFRRVAALRFLKRDAVQARVHTHLSDEDALLMSLAEAIHATPVEPEVLEAKREQLESQGRLSAAVRDMLEKALATEDTLAPEGVEEEIDADELAAEVSQRLGAINQDLALLADVFAALDESRKAELLMQLRYSSELVAYLEGL